MGTIVGGLPLIFAAPADTRPVPSKIGGLHWWDSTVNAFSAIGGSSAANPGGVMGGWSDRNLGVRLDAPSSGGRPTLSSTTTLNGSPTVVFDGSDDALIASSASDLNFTQDFSFILVFNPLGVQGNEVYFSRSDGTANAQYELRQGLGDVEYVARTSAGVGINTIHENSSVSFFNRWTILTGQFAPTSLTYGMRANTQAIATSGTWTQGTLNQQATQRFIIGARNHTTPALFGTQAYRHVMVLNRLFSDNERDALERWCLGNTAITPTFT